MQLDPRRGDAPHQAPLVTPVRGRSEPYPLAGHPSPPPMIRLPPSASSSFALAAGRAAGAVGLTPPARRRDQSSREEGRSKRTVAPSPAARSPGQVSASS